jgi:hypothetical protein
MDVCLFVSAVFCVGRDLCFGLITRPEESYRMCGVSDCDREVSTMWRPSPNTGCRAIKKGRKLELFPQKILRYLYLSPGIYD